MSAEQVNSESIEQTKQQIRSLVSEISQLSKSDIGPEEYYAAFLQRVVSALAAIGGAIWLIVEGRRLQLAYQINISQTLLDSASDDANRHLRLLNNILQNNEGRLVPPSSGAGDEEAGGNPTRYLLVMSPMRSDGKVEGLVEIFQRPDSPPQTQRGYLRFVEQMCELAGEWLKTQKLRQITDRHSLWAQADQFSRMVHESLDLRETCYAVANEGRRVIGVDRVSVAINHGRKCVVEAISGQDVIENRSNVATLLGKLATKVVATGEPLWYEGSTDDFPPQIEQAIETYVDESYAKSIIVLPLRKPKAAHLAADGAAGHIEREDAHHGETIGALIIEQIESDLPRALISPRIDLVYEHGTRALANATDYSTLFLMPVWRTLGRASWIVKARTLPKTIIVASLIVITLLVLTLVKKNFYLKANGSLQPVVKRDVFVGPPGTVEEVLVHDQDMVAKDQPLVKLRNTELEVQIQNVTGELQSAREQKLAVDKSFRNDNGRMSEEERVRLAGQSRELAERIQSLERQLSLLKDKRERLVIRAPISGQVLLPWEVEESLDNRTVETGQVLMTVADVSGDWQVELYMPERRMGHVDSAAKGQPELAVQYVLATDPGHERSGTVNDIQRITQMHEEEGHTVQIRVAIDKNDVRDPFVGATVKGKVLCGRRAIGYTWFHEAVEWVQANLLF